MKRKIIIGILVTLVLSFYSCKKEKTHPSIILKELGHNNSKSVKLGEELHIEAEITAEEKIDIIKIDIHPESSNLTWNFSTVYTEYKGLKNTEFHKHIDIPNTAQIGTYHFHLIVRDLEGQENSVESSIQIIQ